LQDWLLDDLITEALRPLHAFEAERAPRFVAALLEQEGWEKNPDRSLQTWLDSPSIQPLIGMNTYQGIRYVHKESFERWLQLLLMSAAIRLLARPRRQRKRLAKLNEWVRNQQARAAQVGYRADEISPSPRKA
jgi:hypothetical protein